MRRGNITCAALLLSALAACNDITDDIDLPRSSLIVYGRVANQSGAGIAGARVDMLYHPLLCSVSSRNRTNVTTGPDGRYREVFEVVAESSGCLRLRVQAAGFHPDSATRVDGVFKREAPFDSVQTNFTLPAR